MEIGKIEFGEIDAKNEVLKQNRSGKSIFNNSFQNPPGIDIENLLTGENYFIIGQKGCGKTALLLYIQQILNEKEFSTETIFFRSGISEPERQELLSGAPFSLMEIDGNIKIEYDFLFNWLWLIYSNIIRRIDSSWAFQGSEVLNDLKSLLRVNEDIRSRSFSDLTANKINARAKVAVDAKYFNAEISADIEAIKNCPKEKLPLEIISLCERYIKDIKIHPGKRISLAFDELELFYTKKDQRDRDLKLITNLIQAISRANRVFAECNIPITIYASIRSEVLSEVNTLIPEIWRDISDFGVEVNWNFKASADEQPILNIVEAKIHASEIENDLEPTDDAWGVYFPEKIYGKEAKYHLLDIAMFKPRLIILRLNLSKKYDRNSEYFSKDHFEETSTAFSNEVWREVSEQLLQSHSQAQVRNLREVLKGWKSFFTANELETRANDLNYHSPGIIDGFRSAIEIRSFLRSLYDAGAIGNHFTVNEKGKKGSRDRWKFRGFEDPIFDQVFTIHESLRKHFQLIHD